MTASYDAIIIGSRAGGLTPTVALAKARRKVLALEQYAIQAGGIIRSR